MSFESGLTDLNGDRRVELLVVDDDDELREDLCRYFAQAGYNVSDSPSGEHALTLADNRAFDVMILDMAMPGMNGFELAKQIAERSNQSIPVVALTGWGQTLSRQDQSANGVSRVISKPIRLETLREVLDQLI